MKLEEKFEPFFSWPRRSNTVIKKWIYDYNIMLRKVYLVQTFLEVLARQTPDLTFLHGFKTLNGMIKQFPYRTQSFEFGKLRNSIFNYYWYNQNVSVFVHIKTLQL